jgi:hypothetical protein
MRSFRAENVSAFVKSVLDNEVAEACTHFANLAKRFSIVISRDLTKAKQWVRGQARGSERYGLLASSSAQRLKPHAIDVRVNIDPVHYFLGERDDTRSSYYLEDAATEFQVQGLELDWACVTWDADLRHSGDSWSYFEFHGKDWRQVHKRDRQQFLLNAYRVLLTRARQGMAIFVPAGDLSDHTRPPAVYDSIYGFLQSTGLSVLT